MLCQMKRVALNISFSVIANERSGWVFRKHAGFPQRGNPARIQASLSSPFWRGTVPAQPSSRFSQSPRVWGRSPKYHPFHIRYWLPLSIFFLIKSMNKGWLGRKRPPLFYLLGGNPFIYYTLFINELKGGTLGNVPINSRKKICFRVRLNISFALIGGRA